MNTKTLFLGICVLAALGAAPLAMADGETASKAPLATSDEEFLKELAADDTVDASAGKMMDATDLAAGEFFPPAEEAESNVKYVYKGYTDTELRRTIKDDRIDDGYVQGLLLQRGSD